MKKLVAILLIAELVVAYFVLTPSCILRQKQLHAVRAWYQSPTLETNAELDRQNRITRMQSMGFSTVEFALMAGVTLFATRIWTKKHSAQPNLRDETPIA